MGTKQSGHNKQAVFSPPILLSGKSSAISWNNEKQLFYVDHPDFPLHELNTSQFFDLATPTMLAMNERLVHTSKSVATNGGSTIRETFDCEFENFNREQRLSPAHNAYGTYALYPDKQHLVHFAPEWIHRLSLVASNSTLYNSPNGDVPWWKVREIFENTVVGIAGASVGGNIFHSIIHELRPKRIKIADSKGIKIDNLNRIRVGYDELPSGLFLSNDPEMANKAALVAKQAWRIDPYLHIDVYSEGLSAGNMQKFFSGDGKSEPSIDILVEEIDDIDMKVALREFARKKHVPLIMASDMGSVVTFDIIRFDQTPDTPFSIFATDAELTKILDQRHTAPTMGVGDILHAFLGDAYKTRELSNALDPRNPTITSTMIPQLGSTVLVASGIVAELVARIRLGWTLPRFVSLNKATFDVMVR